MAAAAAADSGVAGDRLVGSGSGNRSMHADTASGQKWHLSVKSKAKVKEFEEQRAASHRPSLAGWIVLKWTLTLLIGLCFLASLVFSKVSAVRLAQELYKNSSTEQQQEQQQQCQSASTDGKPGDVREPLALVLLIVSACVPYAVGSVMSAATGLFRHDAPWPSKSAVLLVSMVAKLRAPASSDVCLSG